MRFRVRILAGLLGAMLAAGTVLAVTGNVEIKVTDANNKPIPGAKVSLVRGGDAIPGAMVITDGTGTALLTADEGPVTVVVQTDDDRKETAVTILGGKTVTQTIAIGGAPPSSFLPGNTGLNLHVFGRMVDDGEIKKSIDEFFVDGVSFGATEGDLDALNEDFDHEVYFGAATLDFQWQFNRKGAMGAHGRWLPYVNVSYGLADLDTEFHNNEFPDDSNTYQDQGPTYGAGLGIVFDCKSPGFIGGGIDYRWATGIEADRDPQVATPGGTLLRDNAEMDYTSGTARIFTGREFNKNRANWWVGALYNKTEINLDGTVLADFPTGEVQILFENDIENETWMLEGGLNFRFGQSPVVAGVYGASDGSDFNVGVTIGFTF